MLPPGMFGFAALTHSSNSPSQCVLNQTALDPIEVTGRTKVDELIMSYHGVGLSIDPALSLNK